MLNGLTRRKIGPLSRNLATARVVKNTCFELVPLKNLEAQLTHLPGGASVSVTCSPVKGIDHTLDLAARFRAEGLRPTPHAITHNEQGFMQVWKYSVCR